MRAAQAGRLKTMRGLFNPVQNYYFFGGGRERCSMIFFLDPPNATFFKKQFRLKDGLFFSVGAGHLGVFQAET